MELLSSIFLRIWSGDFQDSQTSFLLIFLIQSSTICKDGRQVESLFSFKRNSSFLLLGCAHLLKEGEEGNKTVISSGVKEFLHESLGLFLGQLLTKVGEETEKLVLKHGVVLVFVVELKDFNEVVESTLVLGVLASLVHGEDVSLGEHLLA